jgi:dihydroxy-acid dehydratase
MATKLKPEDLRSHRWFGGGDLSAQGHRSRALQMGYGRSDFQGKPVIGILNTWSDLLPCHAHFRTRADEVKRGVWQAGGFPVELPVMAVSETFQKPTSMMYRNFLAMETEEMLRSHPIDGAVLMGGCDKTTPGLIMGATSMGLPFIYMPAGPMLRGNWKGEQLGSGTDRWKYWAELRAGRITEDDWREVEEGIARSYGHCMVMGTASTMTSAAETLGLTLPGAASIPAADSGHPRMATASGRRIVEMVWEDLRPSKMLTPQAFDNAIKVVHALSGSTNALIHLVAMAGRAGITIDWDHFDKLAQHVPVLANLRPAGKYLMEDFYYAGGLRALLKEIAPLLDTKCATVNGKTLGENIETATINNTDVIRTREKALSQTGGLAVLRGNLAPDGAVIKPLAAEERLLKHTGPAVVFKDYADLRARIDSDDLKVDENSVLVMQNAGPLGAPGMPEWGQLPVPKKLLQKGIRDMVRISDARMSGTSYGTCVLHVSPEAHIGGPLALVRDGDMIELDVAARKLELKVSESELAQRKAAWKPRPPHYTRGYGKVFSDHITQANKGCDFDFLHHGAPTPDPDTHH